MDTSSPSFFPGGTFRSLFTGMKLSTWNIVPAGYRCTPPGFRLHPLKGDRAGQWSVRVSGNWRVVFRFEDGEAVDVDLVDYH